MDFGGFEEALWVVFKESCLCRGTYFWVYLLVIGEVSALGYQQLVTEREREREDGLLFNSWRILVGIAHRLIRAGDQGSVRNELGTARETFFLSSPW